MADRPLRVALVNHSAALGGAELSLLRLVGALDRDAVSPVVVVGEDGPLVERLREAAVEVVVEPLEDAVRNRRKDSLTASAFADAGALRSSARATNRLRRRLAVLRPDVVHTNSLKAHLLGGAAARLLGKGVVWHVRDHIATPYLPSAAVRAVRAAARVVPHAVIAVSASAARTVPRNDVHVVRQAVPLPPSLAPRAHDDRLRVGLVGRIAPWKGHEIFVAAAARVARAVPEAEFVVAGAPLFGEDRYARIVRRQAELAGLNGRIRFLGFCNDVWSVYRDLDVAVHASTLPEPYGNVVLEAMASRTALVAADAGGVPELVEHGRTGLLVPPADPAALAAAIERLLRDPGERERLAEAGRRHVEENFSLAKDARAIEAIYRSVAA